MKLFEKETTEDSALKKLFKRDRKVEEDKQKDTMIYSKKFEKTDLKVFARSNNYLLVKKELKSQSRD